MVKTTRQRSMEMGSKEMKFTVKRQDLSHVLDGIEGIVEEKSPNPILGYLRIAAYEADATSPASVQLAGTNLKLAIETTISADVEKAGSALTLARPLARVIKSLACDVVSIAVTKNSLVVSGVGTSRTHKLAVRGADDFIKIPTPAPDNQGIPLKSDTIKNLINKVSHAMDTAQSAGRNGVMVEIVGGKCSAVAVNSYQMVVYETDVDSVDWSCMLPSVMHKPLLDLCANSDTIQMKRDSNYLYAETDESIVAVCIPAEGFVPWRKVMEMVVPDPVATVAKVDLVNSIKGVTCVNPSASVCMSFKKEGTVEISSTSEGAYSGEFESSDSIACSTVDKVIDLSVSAAFLLANLRAVDSGEIVLRYFFPNQLVVVGPGYHSLIALTSSKPVQKEPEEQEEKPAKKTTKGKK
jgi:DNA polymerase III sliding clamp (beta) subunit (PCNA family)